MLKLIDTHAHIDQVENIENELEQAHQLGVDGVVAVGVDLLSNQRNLEISKRVQNPKVFLAFGIHPQSLEVYDSTEIEKCISFIRNNIKEAVAVGEIGLDYWYKWAKKDETKKQQQRDVFKRQLALAKEFNLPAIIHSRGSWRDCLDMTKEAGVKKAVFHWYSGPLSSLSEMMECGYYISASPAVAHSLQHQEAVKGAPIKQLLIETDSPVFYGDDESGFRAGPKDVLRTLKSCAQLKNVEEEKAAEIFYANAKDFFGI